MASNTENLNLLMKNPSTDGADTFNVQTMLNENWQKIDNNAGTVAQTLANILKPTTPQIIGLPPSTTPDGMFRALGNTGELHVWRKTVVTSQEIPAGYKLGSVQTGAFTLVSSNYITYEYGTPTISDDGTVGLSVVGTMNVNYQSNLNDLKGKFCRTTASGGTSFPDGQVIFIPGDAVFSTVGVTKETNKYQPVTGYAKVPAGTTSTYPVSTNPNAYQEGSDAKPAGYTLGEVENNVQILSGGDNWPTTLYYADSVDVDNEGHLSLQSPNQYTFTTSSQYQNVSTLAVGRFIKIVPEASSGFLFRDGIWFVPSDATVTVSNYKIYASKIQKVTGYPAIPAGTTIEYLGKLGDKARVQVVSYVGTGTYGSSNPNSLTFDFVPKVIIVSGYYNTYTYSMILSPQTGTGVSMQGTGDRGYVKKITCNTNGKNVSWYSDSVGDQLNASGIKYVAVAIG